MRIATFARTACAVPSRSHNHGNMRLRLWFVSILTISCASHPVASPRLTLPPEPRIVIPREPPPGRVELIPPQPRSDAVWIDGVWNWFERRWVWTKGSWVIAPVGATYSTWSVVRAADTQLYFSPAAWRDTRGNVVTPPPPLATATVTTVPVVNPDGTQARTITKQD